MPVPIPTPPAAPRPTAGLPGLLARIAVLSAVTAAALLLGACSSWDTLSPQALLLEDDVLFVVQSEEPDAVMEALYTGPIDIDANGCLRLESEGDEPGATVVWRPSFSLERSGSTYRVRGPGDRIVGTIGGEFRMGGGFVQSLHDGIPLTDAMRAAALERCPGSYWIVGDIPRAS